MYNTIILKRGEATLTPREYKNFSEGDTIWGEDRASEELKRWPIEEEAAAKKELKKFRCTYHRLAELYDIEEYALEYCECNEDGEFWEGSDYYLAERK